MTDQRVITGTLDELVVGEGESVCLRGTVLGPVEVQAGGELIHEGLITGLLYVERGGRLYVHGVVMQAEWESAEDVEVHGVGRPPEGYSRLPPAGPAGWGAIDAIWGQSLTEIDKAVVAAGLGGYVEQRKEDTTEDVFRAVAATVAIAGRSDDQLWALLSAAIFNPAESARIRRASRRRLASPEDCRERLAWGDLERYFDSPPELFTRLLPHADRTGRSLAFDCYEALSRVMRAVLVIDEPASGAVATVERFRTMLRDEVTAASGARPPRARRTTTRGTKPSRPARTTSGGGGRARTASAALRTETDPVDTALSRLDRLVGLSALKDEVRTIGAYAAMEQRRRLSGLPEMREFTRHLVMTGNPGTGKTTVARLLGEVYVGCGLLDRTDVIEVTRSELVDKYVGKTDENVKEAFDRAAGGILFIDEAYSLARREEGEPDYGRQAIDTLVPLMENRRTQIMVVAAGYPEPMQRFLRANPGLAGRFGTRINFPNYSDDELLEILRRFCEDAEYVLPSSAAEAAEAVIRQARTRMGERFDNARMARRLFEKMVQRHHRRLYDLERQQRRAATAAELTRLDAADLPEVEVIMPDTDVVAGARD